MKYSFRINWKETHIIGHVSPSWRREEKTYYFVVITGWGMSSESFWSSYDFSHHLMYTYLVSSQLVCTRSLELLSSPTFIYLYLTRKTFWNQLYSELIQCLRTDQPSILKLHKFLAFRRQNNYWFFLQSYDGPTDN